MYVCLYVCLSAYHALQLEQDGGLAVVHAVQANLTAPHNVCMNTSVYALMYMYVCMRLCT